jgi:hypothetical protein
MPKVRFVWQVRAGVWGFFLGAMVLSAVIEAGTGGSWYVAAADAVLAIFAAFMLRRKLTKGAHQ